VLGSRLTYANVIATLALLLALGGGAYAAIQLPNNSVDSRNVVNHSLQAKDLANLKSLDASKRVTLTGGTSGSPTTKTVLRRGPLSLVGTCENLSPFAAAHLFLTTTKDHTSVASSADSQADLDHTQQFEIFDGPVNPNPAFAADWFAATTRDGHQLSGIASAGVNNGSDCFFTVAALG
jgi:hypothetical protein